MNITVIGGSGDVGLRITQEALNRDHNITVIARSEHSLQKLPQEAKRIQLEIDHNISMTEKIGHCDLIISAIRPNQGNEEKLVSLTQMILQTATTLQTPVLIVGGAARLKLSEKSDETVLSAPNFLPADIIPIAKACMKQFEICLQEKKADWTYLSPPAMLLPGTRTGQYRLGTDALVTDKQGHSSISIEDFACAVMDEAENPKYKKKAFTVGY